MTRDEILNMPAGREMDALVAEKVMEWTLHPNETHWDVTGARAGMNWRQVGDFKPSTDIAAAWEVVEKMRATEIYGLPVCLCVVFHHSDEKWHVDMFNNRWMRDATASTAPLAVCRAALLAVMEIE